MRQKAGTAAKQRDQDQSEDPALPANTQAIPLGECFLLAVQVAACGVEPVLNARSSRSGKTDIRMLP
jgi:hypothetical protein